MVNQVTQLVGVIYKEFLRNPGIIFWSLFFPLLMAWGLGIAFTKQDQLIRNAAWIQNQDGMSIFPNEETDANGVLTVIAGNDAVGHSTYKLIPATPVEADLMMKKGKVTLVLDESEGEVSYRFDPKNPDAQLAYYHFTSILAGTQQNVDEARINPVTNKGSRYVDFLVPGLIAMNIMMSCMWGISYNLIDKRIRKLLRRMVATPMKKSAFMMAQFIARLGLSGMEVMIIYVFTWIYFGISIQGSITGLLLLFVAGNAAFTGIAILVSSRTANSQVGNGLINLVVMPMMILSGIFFSYHGFPDWVIAFIEWMPLTILADNIRSVFNEGAMLPDVMPAIIILSVTGLVFYGAGIRIYKWY